MSDQRLKKLNRLQALGVLGAAGASLVACNGSRPTSPTAITTIPARIDRGEARHASGVHRLGNAASGYNATFQVGITT